MSTANEHWWERLPRLIFGWGFALMVFLLFPFPEAEIQAGEVVRIEPGFLSWVVYVVLIVFFVGVAHSTVTGIVLENLTKAAGTVRRLLRGKRGSSTEHQQVDDSPTKTGSRRNALKTPRKR